jgi:hypothetical protein
MMFGMLFSSELLLLDFFKLVVHIIGLCIVDQEVILKVKKCFLVFFFT